MENRRPFGSTLLAILAALGAAAAIIHTLQMLGQWPMSFDEIEFFGFSIVGATMWGILAAIYIWLVVRLWNLDPQGWLFMVIASMLNLIMAFVTVLGQTAWNDMLWSLLVNATILIYCLLPTTKDAFGADAMRVALPPEEPTE